MGSLILVKIFNKLYLSVCFMLTKLIIPKARLIRFPIWVSGSGVLNGLSDLTTGRGLRIDLHDKSVITIGDSVEINDYCQISAANSIVIGSNCLIASRVFITDHDHVFDGVNPPQKKEIKATETIIEDNVWIGNGVSVLKGSLIPAGSVIAANSTVNKKLGKPGIYAGSPVKLIREF